MAGLSRRDSCRRETAVICDIGEGPIAHRLRGDIDALPIIEGPGSFASKNHRVAHACGHDVHATTMLGLDLSCSACMRSPLGGTVRIIFQPAEEPCRGAHACIERAYSRGSRHPRPALRPRINVGKSAPASAPSPRLGHHRDRTDRARRPHLPPAPDRGPRPRPRPITSTFRRSCPAVWMSGAASRGLGPVSAGYAPTRSRHRLHGRHHALPGPRRLAQRRKDPRRGGAADRRALRRGRPP